jgi:hypothetical protein
MLHLNVAASTIILMHNLYVDATGVKIRTPSKYGIVYTFSGFHSQQLHNMADYDAEYARFSIEVPEFTNFGFYAIDTRADTCRNKLAMIGTTRQGEKKKFPPGISRSSRTGPRISCSSPV